MNEKIKKQDRCLIYYALGKGLSVIFDDMTNKYSLVLPSGQLLTVEKNCFYKKELYEEDIAWLIENEIPFKTEKENNLKAFYTNCNLVKKFGPHIMMVNNEPENWYFLSKVMEECKLLIDVGEDSDLCPGKSVVIFI